jgi:hypothetical protein
MIYLALAFACFFWIECNEKAKRTQRQKQMSKKLKFAVSKNYG